jgi:hypothetical protein
MKGNFLFFSNELSKLEYFAIDQPISYLKTFVLSEEKYEGIFLRKDFIQFNSEL